MERKFKVGDRVEVVEDQGFFYKGEILTITSLNSASLNSASFDMMATGDRGVWGIDKNRLKLINDMRKEDLKTGMRVELRNGHEYVVMLDTNVEDCFSADHSHMLLSSYGRSLKHNDSAWSVLKVYDCPTECNLMDVNTKGKRLWPRQSEEMTMEEICKELGREVKVKK